MRTKFVRNFIKLTQYDRANFSELAKDLSLSQSTLSNQIKQLEDELGVKLIDRTTRTFSLTKEGEIFLKHARDIIGTVDNCIKELSEFTKNQSEEINISASTLPGSHILPKFIAKFKEDHPNVNFKVIINNSQKSIDLLKRDNAFFAGIGSFLNYNKEDFDYITIGKDHLVFICSPKNNLVLGSTDTITFDELIKYPFISREKGSGTRNEIEQQFPNYEQLDIKLEINDNDSIITAVSDSNYISLLSEIIAKKAENAGLIKIIKVKEHPTIAERDVFLIKIKDKELSKLKKKFWNNIRDYL